MELAPRGGFEPPTFRLTAKVVEILNALSCVAYRETRPIFGPSVGLLGLPPLALHRSNRPSVAAAPRLSRVQVDAIAFRETTEVVGDKEGPHACFSPTRKERVFAKPSPMLLVFLGCPITEELLVIRPESETSRVVSVIAA